MKEPKGTEKIHIEILIIEDDKDIRETVRVLLSGDGFTVLEAGNGDEGVAQLTKDTKLVILDVMLPGKNGYEICEEIRKFSYVPILFLTAKSREMDKLLGFQAGGDDYLVKPFSFAELSARVNALLRRNGLYKSEALKSVPPAFSTDNYHSSQNGWLCSGNLRVSTDRNLAFLADTQLNLTQTEYEILLMLMRNPTRVFSVQNIYETIWNETFLSTYSNSVMVHVRNLRTKIEQNPQAPEYILTVWGKGYRFGQK